MRVMSIVEQAFASAMLSQGDLQKRWIDWSMRMTARTGHRMALSHQSDYHLDLLIRALEAEHAARYAAHPEGMENDPFLSSDTHLVTLSRLWFLEMYETIRTLKKASAGRNFQALANVYSAMHVVRIAISKNQVATVKGQKLPDLLLEAVGDGPKSVIKYDPAQANYRPIEVFSSTTGSVGWYVIDLERGGHREVTRLEFSDAILALVEGGTEAR